jgi:UDP:flavonoid glycosyltransferase YjiC (YdhE family)
VNWAPDVVVHNLTEVAGAEAAALLGVREIVVGPTSGVGRAQELLPLATAELAATLSSPDRYADILAAPYLDPRVPGLAVDRPTGFADVRRVRPELDGMSYRLPLRVQRFHGQRTVLLSLGRHGVRTSLLATALAGLRSFGINVIVETGPTRELTGLGEVPPNVAVGPVIDYPGALPLCAAVVGNASTELTVGALGHGLPMVSLPGDRSQLSTASRVSQLGAGITLQPDRLAPGAVRRALGDVFANPRYAAAAQAQQAAIAALPSAADVLADLTATVPA